MVEEQTDTVNLVEEKVEEKVEEEVEVETKTDIEEETKTKDEVEEAEQKVQDLLVKLVTINGGWFDSDLRKKIKPIPKGWQLLTV